MQKDAGQGSAPDSPASLVDSTLDSVGPRLRDIRNRRSLRLTEVSAATGISVSTLSRLEGGRRRPTLDLLIPLARLYRVALDDIIGAAPSGDPRIHITPVRRDGMVYMALSGTTSPVQAFKIVLPGRRPEQQIKRRTHGGYEWLYVLSGSVDLAVGETVTNLTAGEAAEFDTRQPHGIVSGSTKAAEILTLFSPQGEQIHIHDR